MFAGFCPPKKCFREESISAGKMLTAPNAIAVIITITNKMINTGKINLFRFITGWV